MAFNISSFLGNMIGDGLRPNLFDVRMIVPTGGNLQDFTFKARATSIPSSSIGVATVYHYGRAIKLAGNRTFDNWAVTVLLDENDLGPAGTRGMFERWSSFLNTQVTNTRLAVAPLTYMGNAEIVPYGKAGIPLPSYFMDFCFPIDVGAVNLDWADNDRIAEFTVTFAYQWWRSVSATY